MDVFILIQRCPVTWINLTIEFLELSKLNRKCDQNDKIHSRYFLRSSIDF